MNNSDYHIEEINKHTFRLRHIPETTFAMGSRYHGPIYQVKLSPYYIGELPVTQALWKAIMGEDNTPFYFQGDSRPSEMVSWDDIVGTKEKKGFLEILNEKTKETRPANTKYRLPTEAEWECAARAGRDFEYAGSNKPKEVAWFDKNSHSETKAVGQKKPNDFGLFDMSGNVWEWCQDFWSSDFYQKCADEAKQNGLNYVENPYNQEDWEPVLRGGSWYGAPRSCHVSYRLITSPSNRDNYFGFRLVLSSQFKDCSSWQFPVSKKSTTWSDVEE